MQQSRIIKWLINLALLSILLLVGLLFVFRERVADLSRSETTVEWTTVSGRDKLGREFVWTAQLSKALSAGTQFRLRLTGQTRILYLIFTDTELRVQEHTGSQTEQVLGRAAWPTALKAGTQLQVTKMLDSVSVFLNGQRVLPVPCSLEEWQGGVWETTGMTALPAAFSYQKLDTFLFTDDFMHGEGELGEWKPASGTWTVYALKNPIRSANPFSFWGRGGDAVARTGYWFWRNYEFATTVHPLPDGGFGVFFCQLDDRTRYEVKWQPATGDAKASLRLSKVSGGQTTVLAEKPELFLPTLWLQLRVAQIEGVITVYVDDRLVLQFTDPTPLLGGAIGLWTSGERGAVFDDVIVKPVDAVSVGLAEGKDSPLLHDIVVSIGSPNSGTEKRRRLTLVGLVRQNAQVSVTAKGLSGAGAWVELHARQNGAGDHVGFRVSTGHAGPVAELVLHRTGQTTVLDRTSLPKLPDRARVSLHVQDDEAWGCLDDTMTCFTSGVDLMTKGVCSVLTATDGPVTVEQFGQEPELPLPTIENRVETFTHETSMQGWSSPRLEWVPERCQDTLQYWHRSDFWQDFAVSVDRQTLTDQELTREWGLALRATDQNGDAPVAQAVVVRQDNAEQIRFTFGKAPEQTKRLPLTTTLTSIGIEKRYHRLLVRVNGAVVANQPLPADLQGLCHIGRIGEGSSDAWAQAITVSAAGLKTYSFKEAPADWVPAAGTWEITNRWQCDPRWSFFAGYQNPGVACNWNKRRHGRNVTLEFFAGPKMDAERGKKYEYAADINAVICGDGRDIASGYSFMLGGWDDTGSYIVRGDKVLAENKAIIIPRMSSTHRRWFHVRIRREDDVLTWWIDGAKVASVTDPAPLNGDRFALWTWNNGIMVAQVRVSTDIDFTAAATPVEIPNTPTTPYDSKPAAATK
ncbi:MAG: hypothetical protein A3K19_01405 [Lentisphaerae bacterium RIFOXYB12_FULL_65_16]|nr:MAG: hypothetical protein A3K18_22760 [Lentisphaerae bacterium RIFOXYA12_64_32]OGV92799.1 MAG: hypothetical protein A3K19_01405 [Lentisphaerae bacterium RIFOXYB12_FULL_65_16]